MDFTIIHENDNVKVITKPGADFAHKFALSDISEGSPVIKYGWPIGTATSDIKAGEHVHVHNIKTNLAGELEYTYNPITAENLPKRVLGEFKGFLRDNGKVGIRNEIWIIPTVGCVNGTGNRVARAAADRLMGSVTGVYSFPHPYGCSQLGEDHETTVRLLTALAKHPNAGGVLILGLGCENNTIEGMKEALGEFDESRVKFLICHEHEDEEKAALALVTELIEKASKDVRTDVSTDKLIIGLKCGGSDGLSGITANPLVGMFSDMLVAEGGSAILTEVPEMFGAETILMDRCASREVFDKTVSLINNFKDYYISHNLPVYENPSPGNKAGGISTLEEKSLGCTQKAGKARVVDVLPYARPLTVKGLNLLESPGNDLVAATALAASGAHVVLFTTGLGTPFGSPVPTVKISSNTPLAVKKPNWIDFDAGRLLSSASAISAEELALELYEYVIRLSSGEVITKTEEHNIRDMAIFKNGVTL